MWWLTGWRALGKARTGQRWDCCSSVAHRCSNMASGELATATPSSAAPPHQGQHRASELCCTCTSQDVVPGSAVGALSEGFLQAEGSAGPTVGLEQAQLAHALLQVVPEHHDLLRVPAMLFQASQVGTHNAHYGGAACSAPQCAGAHHSRVQNPDILRESLTAPRSQIHGATDAPACVHAGGQTRA